MKKQELEKLKENLLVTRKRFADDVEQSSRENLNASQRDSNGDLSGYSMHMADIASDNFDREFTIGRISSEQAVLNRIDEALKKMKDETFGICESCEKEISFKRLNAVPYAKLCIKCKEVEEKSNRQ